MQYKDYLKSLDATKINYISFAAFFFMTLSALNGLGTNAAIIVLFQICNQSSKPFFKKILGIFRPSLTIFEISLKRIFNTS